MTITMFASKASQSKRNSKTAPWDDKTNVSAEEFIQEQLRALEERESQMDLQMQRSTTLLSARLDTKNKIATALSMKQILQIEGKKAQATKIKSQLNLLLKDITSGSKTCVDYEDAVNAIIASSAPQPDYRMVGDNDELYDLAKKRCPKRRPSGPRAA